MSNEIPIFISPDIRRQKTRRGKRIKKEESFDDSLIKPFVPLILHGGVIKIKEDDTKDIIRVKKEKDTKDFLIFDDIFKRISISKTSKSFIIDTLEKNLPKSVVNETNEWIITPDKPLWMARFVFNGQNAQTKIILFDLYNQYKKRNSQLMTLIDKISDLLKRTFDKSKAIVLSNVVLYTLQLSVRLMTESLISLNRDLEIVLSGSVGEDPFGESPLFKNEDSIKEIISLLNKNMSQVELVMSGLDQARTITQNDLKEWVFERITNLLTYRFDQFSVRPHASRIDSQERSISMLEQPILKKMCLNDIVTSQILLNEGNDGFSSVMGYECFFTNGVKDSLRGTSPSRKVLVLKIDYDRIQKGLRRGSSDTMRHLGKKEENLITVIWFDISYTKRINLRTSHIRFGYVHNNDTVGSSATKESHEGTIVFRFGVLPRASRRKSTKVIDVRFNDTNIDFLRTSSIYNKGSKMGHIKKLREIFAPLYDARKSRTNDANDYVINCVTAYIESVTISIESTHKKILMNHYRKNNNMFPPMNVSHDSIKGINPFFDSSEIIEGYHQGKIEGISMDKRQPGSISRKVTSEDPIIKYGSVL